MMPAGRMISWSVLASISGSTVLRRRRPASSHRRAAAAGLVVLGTDLGKLALERAEQDRSQTGGECNKASNGGSNPAASRYIIAFAAAPARCEGAIAASILPLQ